MSNEALERAQKAWDVFDFDLGWKVSWRNIPEVYRSTRPYQDDPTLQSILEHQINANYPHERLQLEGAAIVCGDMHQEDAYFKNRYQFIRVRSVDGFDLSPANLARASAALENGDYQFHPHRVDCNNLVLEHDRYHFIVAYHGIHHVYNVSNVFFQCNQALKDNGAMFIEEWIGPRFLQPPATNYWIARILLALLFSKTERTTHENRVKGKWIQYRPEEFEPSEACNSPEIMPEMLKYFEPLHILKYGGLCYPVFEGLGRNFSKSSWRFRFVIYLERALQHLGIIEPFFMQAILKKKKVW